MTPPYGAAFGGWNGTEAVPYKIVDENDQPVRQKEEGLT
jgi:hypothetical protein